MRNYDPSKSPAENNRLTLADQVASGATAALYQGQETPEVIAAKAIANASQAGGAILNAGAAGLAVLAADTQAEVLAAAGAAAADLSNAEAQAVLNALPGNFPAASNPEAIAGTAGNRTMTPASDRAALTAYVDPIAMNRAPADGAIIVDSSTVGMRFTLGSAANLAGSALTESVIIYVPTSNPAATMRFVDYASATSDPSLLPHRMTPLLMTTAGALAVSAAGAAVGADSRSFIWAGFRAAYSGQWVRIDVVLTSGVTNPVIYATGVYADGTLSGPARDISANFTASSGGSSPPDWMSAALVSTHRIVGYGLASGAEIRSLQPINRAVSAAGIAQMVQRGGLLARDARGGSMVAATAGAFVAGRYYRIVSVGSTDFTLVGAASNTVGVEFLATGVGSGTGTANPLGALIQCAANGTSQWPDTGPNGIHGQATAGMQITCDDADLGWVEYTLTTTGAFVTGGSTIPLVWQGAMIDRAFARASTNGADITLRNNSSSTNDIVTAATDLPTANIWVPLTIIDAQRTLAANATLWGSASTGTIKLRVKLSRTN